MNEINCEYSKTIMEEPVCNAFDVNRYGEIICSEENCIILKLKEQLQIKEQECKELKSENFTFEELVKTLDNKIEKLKLQLQAKEKELLSQEKVINRLIKQVDHWRGTSITDSQDVERLSEQLQAKEKECEELKHDSQNIQHNCTREGCKYYDDNTYKVFYNCKGKTELSKYKQALDEIENYCKECNLKADSTACEVLDIIHKAKDSERIP